MYTFLARLKKSEPIDGLKVITLELIEDQTTVEINEGDDFVTVNMLVNPFEG